jgi:transcriptional regulator with PAS, ATPase and Fis domain
MREDIPQLVMHSVRNLNRKFGRQVQAVAPDALAALVQYDFPGNVRELENIIERAYALGADSQIALSDLPTLNSVHRVASNSSAAPLGAVKDLERDIVLQAMRTHGNDKHAAAVALGISERTLYRRLKELKLN